MYSYIFQLYDGKYKKNTLKRFWICYDLVDANAQKTNDDKINDRIIFKNARNYTN